MLFYKYIMMEKIFQEEEKLWQQGYCYVAGVDEAGRGPLAGPVVAAAVMVNTDKLNLLNKKYFYNLRDSKQLSIKQRNYFYKILVAHPALIWATARVSEKVIDKINILEATKLAMARAISKIEKRKQIDYLLIDGKINLNLSIAQKSIIKADEKVFSCMAAGIIAKVYRDRIMKKYARKYPAYGFDRHKGYATQMHLKMIKKSHPCLIHRKSFQSVKNTVIIRKN